MSSRRRLLLGGAAALLTACGRKNPVAPPQNRPQSQPGSRKRYIYPAPETVVPNHRGPARPAPGSAPPGSAPPGSAPPSPAAPGPAAPEDPGEAAGSAT